MWDWKTKSANASFFIALGGGGVLGHFEQHFAGLIMSSVFVLVGIALLLWSYLDRRRSHRASITSESIKRDIEREIKKAKLLKYTLYVLTPIILIAATVAVQIHFLSSYAQVLITDRRPMLAIDTEITPSSIFNEGQQEADVNVIFHVKNVGDEPAYQTRFRFVCAPINQPSNVSTVEDKYQYNPIHKDTKHQVAATIHIEPLIKINNQVVIITRSSLRYCDVSVGDGNWYNVTYWWTLTADFSKKSIEMVAVPSDVKAIYEPYFRSAYPDE